MVEIPTATLEDVSGLAIQELQKKVVALEKKLQRRDEKIKKLQDGLDVSKEKREEIQAAAEKLIELLSDAGWYDIDKYYDEF